MATILTIVFGVIAIFLDLGFIALNIEMLAGRVAFSPLLYWGLIVAIGAFGFAMFISSRVSESRRYHY